MEALKQGGRRSRPGRRLRLILIAAAFLALSAGDRDTGTATSTAMSPMPGHFVLERAVPASQAQADNEPSERPGPVNPAHFFLVLITVLVAGKLGGEVAERFRQPAVLGELLAGMIVGTSVLGIVPTQRGEPLADILQTLAEIGVVLLLFEIGLETDLKAMFRVGGPALMVASVGVACPFALGFLYWYVTNPALGAHPEGVTFSTVAIFVGATLTATSVGITARVLSDLGQMHTPEARTIIGAAVIDDVFGLVILAIVAGLVAGGSLSPPLLVWTFVKASGFLVAAVVIGNFIGPHLFDFIDRLRVRGVLWVSAFSFALLLSALADLADSAMIIGSFCAGIILSSTNQFDLVVEQVKPVADIFTPIFFVLVGAKVNLHLIWPWSAEFDTAVLTVGGVLLAIAVIGKVVSGFSVVWRDMNRLAVGIGMIPRGEVGLIFAVFGLQRGVLSQAVYSAILIMVMFTTLMVPPLLKIVFARSEPEMVGATARASAAARASGNRPRGAA